MLRASGTHMLLLESRVCDLVLDHAECAAVLDRYQIDYDCTRNDTLYRACVERGLDPLRVRTDCELAVRRAGVSGEDLRAWSTKDLITVVIARHHQYLHATLPYLRTASQWIATRYGHRRPALHQLASVIDALATTMNAHMVEQDGELFPALLAGRRYLAAEATRGFDEHEQARSMLAQMRTLSFDYERPVWACGSYRVFMSELAHFEADILLHLHVEARELWPRYIASA
jgi:regulator of cell morphogenesis and NO signaling